MPKAAKEKKDGSKRAKKDPNAPKKALAPYMFFCQEQREVVKAENPDITFGEIGKILGAKWKDLSEKEKKPYMKKAENDKKRYQAEIDAYQAPED